MEIHEIDSSQPGAAASAAAINLNVQLQEEVIMYVENKTLTVSEFCEKYRIHRATYYRNARMGRMPKSIKIGCSTRILANDEKEWLDNQRNAGLAQEALA